MNDKELSEQVLLHLQGFKLDTTIEEDVLSDLEYDKSISSSEIVSFYNFAKSYAITYIGYPILPSEHRWDEENEEWIEEINPEVQNALFLWTAGLVWRKYDVRSNDEIDETFIRGYGDSLITQAKEMLKPFKFFKLKMW